MGCKTQFVAARFAYTSLSPESSDFSDPTRKVENVVCCVADIYALANIDLRLKSGGLSLPLQGARRHLRWTNEDKVYVENMNTPQSVEVPYRALRNKLGCLPLHIVEENEVS